MVFIDVPKYLLLFVWVLLDFAVCVCVCCRVGVSVSLSALSIKRLNRVTLSLLSPAVFLEDLVLLMVFSSIVYAIPLDGNAFIGLGHSGFTATC